MTQMNDCITAVIAASGKKDITDDELERIFTRAQNRISYYQRVEGMDSLGAAQRAGTELGGEIRLAAAVEKRSAMDNMLKARVLDASIIPGREYESVKANLTGVARGTERGLADSVDANYHGKRGQMLGGLLHDLEAAGLLRAVNARDPAFEREISREMWRLREPSLPGTGNRQAEAVAAIFGRSQDATRKNLNDAGAFIGKADNHIARTSHETLTIRGNGTPEAYQAWRADIIDKLNPITFRDTANPEKLLNDVWGNLSSGVHTTSTSETLSGFKGPANLAKKLSQERVLIFKDADSWFDYNAKWGNGSVFNSVLTALDKGSRDWALMRQFGTNPQAMLDGLIGRLTHAANERHDFKTTDQLKSKFPGQVLAQLDGTANVPGSATLANAGMILRSAQQMIKLGGVALTSLPDLAVNAAMLSHNGIPLFEGYANHVRGLLPRGAETNQIARAWGFGIEGMLGNLHHALGADDGLTGRMAKASNLFFKFNLLTPMTDAGKRTGGLTLAANLADNAATKFADLPPRLQGTLRRYGIEDAEWDLVRASPVRTADGQAYLMPESVGDGEASRKLAAYLADQVREGMTESTAGTRAMATWGTQRGTWGGEIVRAVMQFKNYPLTFMARSLGREFTRDGVDIGGVASLIAGTTVLGYLSLTLKDLAKGRDLRVPQSTGDYAKLVAASLVQGGGLVLYGDFLFGEFNRHGRSFGAQLAGPSVGTLDEVAQFLSTNVRGQGHLAADAIRLGVNHTPFINLFYTRTALDYLVIHGLQEAANPGYLRRYQQKVEKDNAQTFWLPPTSAVRF